jgi:hypothetical protein
MAMTGAPAEPQQGAAENGTAAAHDASDEPIDREPSPQMGEPVLTADELQALLHETSKPYDSGPEDTWNDDLRDSRE